MVLEKTSINWSTPIVRVAWTNLPRLDRASGNCEKQLTRRLSVRVVSGPAYGCDLDVLVVLIPVSQRIDKATSSRTLRLTVDDQQLRRVRKRKSAMIVLSARLQFSGSSLSLAAGVGSALSKIKGAGVAKSD